MNFLENVLEEKNKIEEIIKRYGYAPEHNFWWYCFNGDKDSKNVFVESGGAGLFTIEERDKKQVYVFSSPIAPAERRCSILFKYLEEIFKTGIEKVIFELESPLYKEFTKNLPQQFRARTINYTLTWPIYNLEEFDASLAGGSWKTLRKAKNKFYQNNVVTIEDAKTFKYKQALLDIIKQWKKNRGAKDRSHFSPYMNLINANFQGTCEARVMLANGKVVGLNAGWMIENSNTYYGAIGIHNYSLPDLGDVLYLEDLLWLKQKGYKQADMGGGEKALTEFKNKFHPVAHYKTHIFSVVKQ